MPVFDDDAYDRISRVVHYVEALIAGSTPGEAVSMPPHYDLVVQITGAKVAITTTTNTLTTTTSTTTTSSTCSTSATTPHGPKSVYPGFIVDRNIDSLADDTWWLEAEDCYVEEMNQGDLEFGKQYPGIVTAAYRGLPVVSVWAGANTTEVVDVQLCRVWAAAVTDGLINYYPAHFNYEIPSTNLWFDPTDATYDCFLIQRFGINLTVGSGAGGGCYLGKKQSGNKTLTVGGVSKTLPVYATTEFPCLDADCNVVN